MQTDTIADTVRKLGKMAEHAAMVSLSCDQSNVSTRGEVLKALDACNDAFCGHQESAERPAVEGGATTQAPVQTVNDARIYGSLDPDLLARPIEIGLSKHGSKTLPGRWKNWKATVGDLVGVLSRHQSGAKDGNCILQGAVIDGERKAAAIKHLDLLVLDLDTGESIDAIRERLRHLGLFGMIYTTHSHDKTTTTVRKDTVIKWLGESRQPEVADVVAYLREEKKVQPAVLEGAVIKGTEHTKEGVQLVLEHQPMPKFRVVMVLKERFVIAERAATQKDAITEWKERYAGASKLLGAYFDRSCVDPSRLFYTARHPEGATGYLVEVIAGKPLDINEVDRITASELKMEAMSPFERAALEDGGSETKTTSLRWFFAKYGERFEIDDFLLEMDPDGDRGARPNGPGRTHRCPNDDEHSNAGDDNDVAFFCVNASDSDSGKAVAHCQHAACASLDRMHFTDIICQRVGIADATELKKWTVQYEGDEEEEDQPQVDKVPGEPTKGGRRAKHQPGSASGDSGGDDEIVEWNRKYAYVATGSGRYVRFVPGVDPIYYSKQAFMDLTAHEQHVYKVNGAVKRIPFVQHWLRSPQARKYGGLTFAPGMPDAYDADGRLKKGAVKEPLFNVWRGWGVEPKPGRCDRLLTHAREVLASGDDGEFRNIVGWLARVIQNVGKPNGKLPIALVIFGKEEGTGKSLFFKSILRMFGKHGVSLSKTEHITGRFNATLGEACFLVAEEAIYADDPSIQGPLKDLLSSSTMILERKGLDPVTVPNFLNCVFISNSDRPVPINLQSRRFHALRVKADKKGDTAYFEALAEAVNGDETPAFLHYLLNWKPENEDWSFLNRMGHTQANAEMIAAKLHPFEQFMVEWIAEGQAEALDSTEVGDILHLNEEKSSTFLVADIAKAYAHFAQNLPPRDRGKVNTTATEVGKLLSALFAEVEGKHTKTGNVRVFPPLDELLKMIEGHQNKGLAVYLAELMPSGGDDVAAAQNEGGGAG
jgi:hypothetical protein